MSDVTQETLESIEALLVRNFTSPKDAIKAAYRLGKYDGQLEMAKAGEQKMAELLKAAA